MPAQTHGRARNGFHILANSRGRLTNLNQAPCDTNAACEKAYCCGTAIQPAGMKPQGCRRGLCSFTHNRGRKRALALGGIGSRSSTIKRAITRRVQNRNQMPAGYEPSATKPRNAKEWPTKDAVVSPLPCHHITVPKINDRDVSLDYGVAQCVSPCTKPGVCNPKYYTLNDPNGKCPTRKSVCASDLFIRDPSGIVKINIKQHPSPDIDVGDWGYIEGDVMSELYQIVDDNTIRSKIKQSLKPDLCNPKKKLNLCTSWVTNMENLFSADQDHPLSDYLNNNDISSWDTSGVTTMKSMFYNCTNFNQTIGNWDVKNVLEMSWMFYGCTNFNPYDINHIPPPIPTNAQKLSNWNVSNVTSMYNMFYYATNFNQDLSSWDSSHVTNCSYFGSEGQLLPSGAYYWPVARWPQLGVCH